MKSMEVRIVLANLQIFENRSNVIIMDKSEQEELKDEELKIAGKAAVANLASGKKELTDLVEGGIVQPDDRVIALRAENQRNQLIANESAELRKEIAEKKDGK